MAKRKKAQPWDAVYDQINVHRDPDWVLIPSPTDAELDHVAARLGSPLPLSYRAFLKRFGPGEIDGDFRLTPLALPNQLGYTLVEETERNHAFFVEHKDRNTEWLGRVVYFGCHSGGDHYVWDPKELAESKNQECPVYWLPRHEEEDPQQRAASFWEFIRRELELGREVRDEVEDEEDIPENAFAPYYLRMKVRPSKAEVRLWLASNNHTARDLARAIRGGHTDAFPILADALEEAGCTNADLLDACRTGDPDIDGAWVLQVLLGRA